MNIPYRGHNYSGQDDQHLQSIAHGVIRLEHLLSDYGGERRRLRVLKHRGSSFVGGAHDLRILRGGLKVYPREITGVPLVETNPAGS